MIDGLRLNIGKPGKPGKPRGKRRCFTGTEWPTLWFVLFVWYLRLTRSNSRFHIEDWIESRIDRRLLVPIERMPKGEKSTSISQTISH